VHQYGWRYLDLKPSNLLIDRHGMLKLADFGTNRPLAELDAHSYTGTASWQAPEQFFAQDGGYRTDARSDYFALGALFYHLLTGALLRYSAACGAAFREHGTAGAAHLRGQHGGQLPAVLAPDEAALFARHARARARARGTDDGATAQALVLLRALLQPRPERRPRHALEISRLIAQARSHCGAALTLRSAA
jgi:serine/threonine-protein kinase